MGKFIGGICAACHLQPVAARTQIDGYLLEKPRSKTLRQLEELSGISKSALSRHYRNCLQGRHLQKAGSKRSAVAAAKRFIVEWPSGEFIVINVDRESQLASRLARRRGEPEPIFTRSGFRDGDLLIRVSYDEDLPPLPPAPAIVEEFLLQMGAKDEPEPAG